MCALLITSVEAAVTVKDDGSVFTMVNGYLTAQVNKSTGDLASLKVKDLELMGYQSGHHAGYWEQSPARSTQLTASVTIDPSKNSGERGEVSVKGLNVPGLSYDLEIRYTLASADHGIYTYAIFTHRTGYAKTQVGESRYGAKISAKVFDWMSIDSRRNKLMPTGADWDHGSPLNMKEARRLTTGIYRSQVEHKYDYSAIQSEIPAFGWSSTKEHVGFFFINPSMEFLSGGPTKVELTGHLDDNDGGDPTILDYWRGTHYGGSILPLAEDERWTKVVGPIFIYVPQGPTPEAMFQDALEQAKKEAALWPYAWVQGVDYPLKAQRGTVTGQLTIGQTLPNLWVGLAEPDSNGMTWQNDAKHYEFWQRGTADGRFEIGNVRPGTYELHAIADGVLGEYSKVAVTVAPGAKVDLGKLEWTPLTYGKQLWEIGIPNRSGSEFFKGDDYFHWGWYLEYPKLFPNDVHYVVGKSDYRKDWFFEQVPHAGENDGTGRGNGAATTWTIGFSLPENPKGKGILRLAITGVAARRIDVGVNGKPAGTVEGLVYNATINRDGIRGHWVEKDVTFDAALMHAGNNELTLTIPAGGLMNGIIYDYLRLELAP